ncbi:hypothetical protein BKA83DRAFT_4493801 [Pisolithus microcarpus]|nr:hypothetical protein BKA83DRAFT_4493801 [Pisolithus microcarpus]
MPAQSSPNHSVSTPQSSHFALPSTPPSSKTDMTSPPPTNSREKTVPAHTVLPANSLKRTHFQLALPSDTSNGSPHKRAKKLMTTATASISQEVEDLRSHRTLQLARATRDAFAAGVRYRHLRLREIELMRIMATDEYEEAEALLKAADRQIGEVKHILNCEGRGSFNIGIKIFPEDNNNSEGTDSYSGPDNTGGDRLANFPEDDNNSEGTDYYSGLDSTGGDRLASPSPSGSDDV